MKIEILAIGRLKKGALFDVANDYLRRINLPCSLIEMEGKNTADEHKKLMEAIRPEAFLIAMDETGKSLSSRKFAQKIQTLQNDAQPLMQIIIGGADGLNDEIRSRANLLLSFGAQTWPHMLARVMLLEQIYRVQQILSNHPYHRD
jgi:23S rRNA (pseudouridine1915-N3)-methyltransferase